MDQEEDKLYTTMDQDEDLTGVSNIDNNMKYQDTTGVPSVDNNMKYQDTTGVSNVDNNMKYQDEEDNHVMTQKRSTKPTTRETQNTKKELKDLELQRNIEKSLKIKEATAKQELEDEKHPRRNKYIKNVSSVEASSRQRRGYPISEGDQVEAKVNDQEISENFRNAKLDYFQKKKAHNDSIINSIKKTASEIESEKRKEMSKKKLALLTEDMETLRLEQLRTQKEKQEELKSSDYKNIVRETRRADHRQLSKAVEEHNKALQTQHKEDSSVAASQYQDKVAYREFQWQKESQAKEERELERQKRREERYNRVKQENKQKKELQNSQLLEMEMHGKNESSWYQIYETRADSDNVHFPRAVQDERVVNVLTNIDEPGSDEEVDHHEAQRQRKEKQVTYRDREIERDVQEAKRLVTDKVLYRAKVQRKTIF